MLTTIIQNAPNYAFLSDAAAFAAGILAFLVPLSLDIVARVSERYESHIVAKAFEQHWETRSLPPLLLFYVFLAITLRFFAQDGQTDLLWAIFAWLVLLSFMASLFLLSRVVRLLRMYLTNPRSLMDTLLDDAEQILQN